MIFDARLPKQVDVHGDGEQSLLQRNSNQYYEVISQLARSMFLHFSHPGLTRPVLERRMAFCVVVFL